MLLVHIRRKSFKIQIFLRRKWYFSYHKTPNSVFPNLEESFWVSPVGLINAPWRGGSEHQGREGDRDHGEVLTWVSRVITGLGCGSCGKKRRKCLWVVGKCNLLPWHHFKTKLYFCGAQATARGGWPHSVTPIPCDILHLLPHPHEEGG